MMNRIQKLAKIILVMVVMVTSFSSTAMVAQAAGPRHDNQRWEDRWNRNDRRDDWNHRDDRNWNKDDHKTQAQKDADEANKKANWALGIAVVAGIIAATK